MSSLNKEKTRFVEYQESYYSKAPTPPPMPPPPDKGAATATKTMGARKAKYPQNKGLSPQGRQNIQNGARPSK